MKAITMMEMEQHIKTRYDFAMSAFARMYGVKTVSSSKGMHKFCHAWAESSSPTPQGTLVSVNFYFKDLWDVWGE